MSGKSGAFAIKWEGLDELKEQLKNLPPALMAEATRIAESEANAAELEIRSAYPKRTGKLRESMTQDKHESEHGFLIRLINTSRYAWFFEVGTNARHNALGAARGSTPAGNVFIPRIEQHRRRMFQRIAEMMRRHGLIVSGDFT